MEHTVAEYKSNPLSLLQKTSTQTEVEATSSFEKNNRENEVPELVTLGKVDRENTFSLERNSVVAVGVAPTIQTLITRASSTALRASTTTANTNIAENQDKSIQQKHYIQNLSIHPQIWGILITHTKQGKEYICQMNLHNWKTST